MNNHDAVNKIWTITVRLTIWFKSISSLNWFILYIYLARIDLFHMYAAQPMYIWARFSISVDSWKVLSL